MTTINGYQLHGDLNTLDAGFSRWAFCAKGGHEYHIKEFLSPVYPQDGAGLSAQMLRRKRRLAESFFAQKCSFYDVLKQCRSGNNVIPCDFFRFGSRYYVVTDRIYTSELKANDVHRLSTDQRMTLVKALLYSVATFHEQRIVHGDLKPDNLLLKRTKDGYHTAKIIDFDGGFVEGNTPEDLQGDTVYLSPEAFLHMNGQPVEVTTKADVFALGLLIHQYWTGSLPTFDKKYDYAFQAVLCDAEISVRQGIPEPLRTCVVRMLSKEPEYRPSVSEVLGCLGVKAQGGSSQDHQGESCGAQRKDGGSGLTDRESLKSHRRGLFVPTLD